MKHTEHASWIDSDLSDLIATIQSGQRPYGGVTEDGGDIPSLGGENIRQGGGIEVSAVKKVPFAFFRSMTKGLLANQDVLINKDGANTGKVGIYEGQFPVASINEHLFLLRGKVDRLDQRFLYRVLSSEDGQRVIRAKISGSAQPGLKSDFIRNFPVRLPESSTEQSRIAAVLDTVDEAIAKTEAVIAKLKQVRAGLLHDLLTRGLDENAELRDPVAHPEQFKDSPLGRIPREWQIKALAEMIASAVDGPFGSNLKTAHYISHHGVRVVRLQNIESGWFDDSDKAFVSEEHALSLQRHQVVPGDLLVACMGDENHPLARACLYPAHLPPGVVKADCFRIRMKPTMAVNGFIMLVLNCPSTRGEVNVLGQGVTRDRVNLTTLLTLRMLRPPVEEQKQIFEAVDALAAQIQIEESLFAKLLCQKSGLMNDLLTGRVRVPESIMDDGGRT